MIKWHLKRIKKIDVLTSFLLFPVIKNYFSPYLIVESVALGIINGSFMVFAILFLSSLIVGRFWCGWLCPAAGLQEATFIAVDKRAAGGKYNLIKYAIWLPWLIIIGLLAFLAGGYTQIIIREDILAACLVCAECLPGN